MPTQKCFILLEGKLNEPCRNYHLRAKMPQKLGGNRAKLVRHTRRIFESAYNSEINVLEPRLVIKPGSLQAILEEAGKVDKRAKKVRVEDLVDRSYIEELEKSAFFEKLWAVKRLSGGDR